MSKVKYEFSTLMQIKIVAMMLFDRPTFVHSMDVVLSEYFENPVLKGMVEVIYSFYDRYENTPDHEEFLEECTKHFGKTRISGKEWVEIFENVITTGEANVGKFEYIKDQVIAFARYQAVKQAVLTSAEELGKDRNYEKILGEVEKAVLVGESSDSLGTDYFKDVNDRLKRRREGDTRMANAISTGVPGLDRALCGGLGGRELGILMSPMKRGKSTTVVFFGTGALKQGKNVLHLFFEGGSEDTIMSMYDACVSGVPKNELQDREPTVQSSIEDFLEQKHIGRLVVKSAPANAWSTRNIDALIQKLRMMENFEPDLIILDYLGLMRSADTSLKIEASSGGRYFLLGSITKELLNLKDKHKLAMWVVHQSTRSSKSKKGNVDLEDSGDSIEVMRDADLIITLNQTGDEADPETNPGEQKMRYFLAGGRAIPDRKQVHTIIDKSICRIRDDDVGVVVKEDSTGLKLK